MFASTVWSTNMWCEPLPAAVAKAAPRAHGAKRRAVLEAPNIVVVVFVDPHIFVLSACAAADGRAHLLNKSSTQVRRVAARSGVHLALP